jgi:hypothetical protein
MPRQLTPAQRRQLERVSPDGFRGLRRERQQLLIELSDDGWTVREIAAEMGVKHPVVVHWMHEDL